MSATLALKLDRASSWYSSAPTAPVRAVYFPSFLVETGYGLVQDERILLFSVLHLLDMVGHEMFDAPQWVTVYGFFFRIDLGWHTPLLLLTAIWAATASAVTLRLQRLEVTH